jgi:hypothetical protein
LVLTLFSKTDREEELLTPIRGVLDFFEGLDKAQRMTIEVSPLLSPTTVTKLLPAVIVHMPLSVQFQAAS